MSGFGKKEDAEYHAKLKMDMETTTSKGDGNLKELGPSKLEELDQLHHRVRKEMAIKLQVQQQVFKINLWPFRSSTGKQ